MNEKEREYKIIERNRNEVKANNAIQEVKNKTFNLGIRFLELVLLLIVFVKEKSMDLKVITGLLSLLTAGYSIYDLIKIFKSFKEFMNSASIVDNIDSEITLNSLK